MDINQAFESGEGMDYGMAIDSLIARQSESGVGEAY